MLAAGTLPETAPTLRATTLSSVLGGCKGKPSYPSALELYSASVSTNQRRQGNVKMALWYLQQQSDA